MAKIVPKPLRELLQEKQEPFFLDIYLLEKGYLRNRFNSDPSARCCSVKSRSLLKRSPRLRVNKKSKLLPNCSKVVKAVFGKLVLESKMKKDFRINEEATRKTLSNLHEKENEAKKKLQERHKDNKKQLSLGQVSVRNESLSCDDLSAHGKKNQISRTRHSVPAIPSCKFTVRLPPDDPNVTDFPSQHSTTKNILHQSKQLLFDCVRELITSNKWKHRRESNLLQYLGPEEIGKILCDDVTVWSKLSGNESNITRLLSVDFGFSIDEWSNFETQTKEVSAEIGDAIFEDISNEIVAEMVMLFQPH